MGLLGKILGVDPAKTVEAVSDGLDKLFTSKEEKLTHKEIMERIRQRPDEAQWAINLAGVQHRSVFVAGWRPGIGWVAAIALFFFYVPQFVMATWVWLNAVVAAEFLAPLPPYPVSADGVLELVAALLGMASLRTYEKLKGLTK
jgi:hypothetical protein